jgi:hypothetical protein
LEEVGDAPGAAAATTGKKKKKKKKKKVAVTEGPSENLDEMQNHQQEFSQDEV